MSVCKDCLSADLCKRDIETIAKSEGFEYKFDENCFAGNCPYFKDKSLYVKLPCKVGSTYYTIERTCSDGGYEEKWKHIAHAWDCEYCNEECDKEYMVVERTFYTISHIIEQEPNIGKTIFLTREEAEQKLKEAQA
jgi:hypothetical protein